MSLLPVGVPVYLVPLAVIRFAAASIGVDGAGAVFSRSLGNSCWSSSGGTWERLAWELLSLTSTELIMLSLILFSRREARLSVSASLRGWKKRLEAVLPDE